jgi:hypothetical protein
VSARNGALPGGFTWRGIKFSPPQATDPGAGGFYSSEIIGIADDRTADWKVHRPKTVWHARLRIGAERYPGVGETRAQALEAAAAEAQNVAAFIVAMLPAGPPARELAPRGRSRRKPRASKGRR